MKFVNNLFYSSHIDSYTHKDYWCNQGVSLFCLLGTSCSLVGAECCHFDWTSSWTASYFDYLQGGVKIILVDMVTNEKCQKV